MKKMKLWMMAAILTFSGYAVLTSCTDSIADNPTTPDQPEQVADYTVIYYGHGGGNLDLSLLNNLKQFTQADAKSYDNVNICVQYKYSTLKSMMETYENYKKDTYLTEENKRQLLQAQEGIYPHAGKTLRYVVAPADDSEDIPYYGLDNADATQIDSLVNFINWAATTCPAKKYVLIVSDHGGGYLPSNELPVGEPPASTRGVMFDDGHNSNHFTAKTLPQAIGQAAIRPQVVYMDACLMNSVEYQFELAPVCDYLTLSTFLVPGQGGDYVELVNALSQNPTDVEAALTRLAKATVNAWDQNYVEGMPLFHDMTVTRTAGIDALGAEIRKLTDKLVDAYQNGGDEVKDAIDECTATAYRTNENSPFYDFIDYLQNLCIALPDVFGNALTHPMGTAFDNTIVYQQSSTWVEENHHTVDLSIMLSCKGYYTVVGEQFGVPFYLRYYADGDMEAVMPSGESMRGDYWGSTLDATYCQLRFDQQTGWSRWLKLNEQEPNLKCANGFDPTNFVIGSYTYTPEDSE